MEVKALGFVSAADAPKGCLIAYPDGTIVFVSEYSKTMKDGDTVVGIQPECYIVNSGEYFCGDYQEKGMLIEIETDYPVEE